MKNIKNKLDKISDLREEIDSHIWNIFYRYREEEKILFSGPDDWYYEEGDTHIRFEGEDGCMGCYDHMSLCIPIEFFEDPDFEFTKLREDKENKEKEEKRNKQKAKDQRERAEFKRLKEKFNE